MIEPNIEVNSFYSWENGSEDHPFETCKIYWSINRLVH